MACPADAIYLEAAENDGSVMAGPRYASIYRIHKTRCIFCGYCEEARPVSAIFMGKDYELAVYDKRISSGTSRTCWSRLPVRRPPDNNRLSPRQGFEALDRRVLVCDGAMGTMLYAKGIFLNRCFDELNLMQPELVAEVHRDTSARART